MLSLDIKVDTKELSRWAAGFEKQVPFALSLALNLCAGQAVTTLQDTLGDYFTLRERGGDWLEKGIVGTRATKRDPTVKIGSRDAYMEQHVTGADRDKGAGWFTIPQAAYRPLLSGKWSRSAGALHRLLARRRFRAFIVDMGNRQLVFQRVGPSQGWDGFIHDGSDNLKLAFVRVHKIHVPKRWPLLEIVKDVMEEEWPIQAEKAMKRAIATAR